MHLSPSKSLHSPFPAVLCPLPSAWLKQGVSKVFADAHPSSTSFSFSFVKKAKQEIHNAVRFSSNWGWSNAAGVCWISRYCYLAVWILIRSIFLSKFQIWLCSCHLNTGLYSSDVAVVYQPAWLAAPSVIDGHVTWLWHRTFFFPFIDPMTEDIESTTSALQGGLKQDRGQVAFACDMQGLT